MAQGPHRIADRRREIWVSVDTKLPKEPYHCHLYYKGELVGCILLENESKEKTFKSNIGGGFLSVFKKNLRSQFEFIPEIKDEKLGKLVERYKEDFERNAALGAVIYKADTDMIGVAQRFVRENVEVLLEDQKSLNMRK